jgi:hypothetical protein
MQIKTTAVKRVDELATAFPGGYYTNIEPAVAQHLTVSQSIPLNDLDHRLQPDQPLVHVDGSLGKFLRRGVQPFYLVRQLEHAE